MKNKNQESGMRISKQVQDPPVPNRAKTEMKNEQNTSSSKNQQKSSSDYNQSNQNSNSKQSKQNSSSKKNDYQG